MFRAKIRQISDIFIWKLLFLQPVKNRRILNRRYRNSMICTFAANSLSDLTVSVDDVYCGNVTVSPGVGASVLVTCDTPLAGRTVKVTRDANTLTMAEVELITIC